MVPIVQSRKPRRNGWKREHNCKCFLFIIKTHTKIEETENGRISSIHTIIINLRGHDMLKTNGRATAKAKISRKMPLSPLIFPSIFPDGRDCFRMISK
jgi:hypothetical protein